ncbi:SAM and SH3 domain-containing protein 1-like isoform X4, partial [Clarias magur]
MEADQGSPPAGAQAGVEDSFSQLWADVMGMLVSVFVRVCVCVCGGPHTDMGEGVRQE